MRVFSKRNLRKFQEIEGDFDLSFIVSKRGTDQFFWIKVEDIFIGITIDELEKLYANLKLLHHIVKNQKRTPPPQRGVTDETRKERFQKNRY